MERESPLKCVVITLKNSYDKKIFSTIGASNHSTHERQNNDFYATSPIAAHILIGAMEERLSNKIWECACGTGHLSRVFIERGYEVRSTDVIDRGYGQVQDFLSEEDFDWKGDIVTNPPYKHALEFCKKALQTVQSERYVCMFLKLTFLEGKARKSFFEDNPPKYVFVSSSRIQCAMNGDFDSYPSSAIAYAWFVWQKGYKGDCIVRWIN